MTTRPATIVPLSQADQRALGLLAKVIYASGAATPQAQDAFQDTVSGNGFRVLVASDVGDVSRTAIECLKPLLPWLERRQLIRRLRTDPELRVKIVVQIGAFQETLRKHRESA